jgi:hypothetical protein
MWRALIAALPLAELFLMIRYGPPAIARTPTDDKKPDNRKISERTESIAEIVQVIRSKPFQDLCVRFGLGSSSDHVAASPNMFRVVIAYARRSRSGKRR